MRHVTYIDATCHTPTSQIHTVTYTQSHTHSHLENSAGGVLLQENESCPVYQSVMSHISMRHVTYPSVAHTHTHTRRVNSAASVPLSANKT